MYKLQEKPDEKAFLASGSEVTPLATLKDEYGGISHIIEDDHCYVLINGSQDRPFKTTAWWYEEAAEALAKIVADKHKLNTEQPTGEDGQVDDIIGRIKSLEETIFLNTVNPEQTRRVLEDLQDRACETKNLAGMSLSRLTDWIRSLYPELYANLM